MGLHGGPAAPLRDAFGRTKEEQDAAALPVLERAFGLLASSLWIPDDDLARWGNTPIPENGLCLADAINWAGDGRIEGEYARRLIRKFEFYFIAWERHPMRTKDDVLQLLRKAIVLGGGEAPPMPRPARKPHRGGWRIGSAA